MSENGSSELEHTDRPKPGAKKESLAVFLGVDFYRGIRLDRKIGLEFASIITDFMPTENVSISDNRLVIKTPANDFEVHISQTSIQLVQKDLSKGQEFFEKRFQVILNRFSERFSPEMILSSKAMIRALIEIDGDARSFIGFHLMRLNPETLTLMKRPLHLFGLRLFFPPFEVEQSESEKQPGHESAIKPEDWSADVKIESWIENPSKLFLEVDGRWDEPKVWNNESVEEVWSRVATVDQFIDKNLAPYLNEAPDMDDNDN
ncbi:MAG: hypothetical protein ABSA77_01345 [Thermoguttaceae bacterium]|jgi:hypothetical protein